MTSVYDTLSPSIYHRYHQRFLRISGGEGQSAAEGAIVALSRPGLTILDAGSGTGGLARRLLLQEPSLAITMLDKSPRLLQSTHDLPVRCVYGDMQHLPFADNSFELVLALWSLETTDDPLRAVRELVRVTRPDGSICALFCATSETRDVLDSLMAWRLRLRGTGRYLDPQVIKDTIVKSGAGHVTRLACHGPVASFLAQKDR